MGDAQSDEPDVLDPEFYRAHYPDVTDLTDDLVTAHFDEHGRAEGRFPTAAALVRHLLESSSVRLPHDFDEDDYLLLNPDVADAACYAGAGAVHFLAHGHAEGRIVTSRPDADLALDFYRSYYTDLGGLSDSELLDHYQQSGRAEGRFSCPESLVDATLIDRGETLPDDFDESRYLEANQDVRSRYPFLGAGAVHYAVSGRLEGRPISPWAYDEARLHLHTNRVHDLPGIEVVEGLPARVNVLVPAFDFDSMSAGFFGVFQVARYLAQRGHRVRLVMFDNFAWDEQAMRTRLRDYPGLEHLLDEVESLYIGERLAPLAVSPSDTCVATVWYSAYFAQKVMSALGGGPFIYLIQDHESGFYASSAMSALAEESYSFDHWALFSSEPLMTTFRERGIGHTGSATVPSTSFNNAAATHLLPLDEFVEARADGRRRLVFYSRPQVSRNMFELGALALCRAVSTGVLDPDEWDFLGMGLGEASITLAPGVRLTALPRMSLGDYQRAVGAFDLGLCLMASPHPSLLPFDLAGSGAIVVTNTFGVKDQGYFDRLAPGCVVATAPTLDGLVEGIERAVTLVPDLALRHRNAAAMVYPRSWSETDEHGRWVDAAVMAGRSRA